LSERVKDVSSLFTRSYHVYTAKSHNLELAGRM